MQTYSTIPVTTLEVLSINNPDKLNIDFNDSKKIGAYAPNYYFDLSTNEPLILNEIKIADEKEEKIYKNFEIKWGRIYADTAGIRHVKIQENTAIYISETLAGKTLVNEDYFSRRLITLDYLATRFVFDNGAIEVEYLFQDEERDYTNFAINFLFPVLAISTTLVFFALWARKIS